MSQRDEEFEVPYVAKQHEQYVEDAEDFKAPQQPHNARISALVLGLLSLVAIGLGVYFFMDKNDYDLKKVTTQNENFQGVVSLESIAEHAVPEDCWIGIHGNAYDLTEYAPIHPGEPTLITRHCGTDATVWYDFEHSKALLPIVDEYLLGRIALSEELEEELEEETTEDTAASSSLPTSSPVKITTPTLRPTRAPVTPNPTPSGTLEPTETPSTSPTPVPTELGCEMEFYTVSDVAQHPDEDSCWYALYGVVYDLTWYIDKHKGGRGTILMDCGKDATVNFVNEKKHDVNLLVKKGFASSIIGRLGTRRGRQTVPCDEVDLVAVTGV